MASNLIVPTELLAATATAAALPPFPVDCAVESSPSQAASTPKKKLSILRAGDVSQTATAAAPAVPAPATSPEQPAPRAPSTPERQQANTGNKKQKGGKGAKSVPRSPTKQGTAGNPQKPAAAAAEKKPTKPITIQRPPQPKSETQPQPETSPKPQPQPQPKDENRPVAIYSIHQLMALREQDAALSDELQERVRTLLSVAFTEHAAPERPQSPSRKQRAEGAASSEKRGAGEGTKPRHKVASSRTHRVTTTVDESRRYTIEQLLSIKRGMTHFGPAILSLRAIRLKRRERFWDSPTAPSSGSVSSAFLLQDGDEDDECTMEAMSRATMEESILEEQMSRTDNTDAFGRAEDPLFGTSSRPTEEEEDHDEDDEQPESGVSPFAAILGETNPADIALCSSARSSAFVDGEEELESPFVRFGAPLAASPSAFPPMPAGFVLAGGDLMSETPARQTVAPPSLLPPFGVVDQGQIALAVPPLPAAASVAVESPEPPVDLLALSASQGSATPAGLVLPPLPAAVAAAAAAAGAAPDLPALPVSAVFESGSEAASSLPAPALPALPEGAIVVGSAHEGHARAGALPALPEGAGVASIDELESVSAPATPVKAAAAKAAPRKAPVTPQERSRRREEREKIARQRRALRYLAQSNPASISVSETLRASGRSGADEEEDEEEDEGDGNGADAVSINVHVGVDEATVKALYHGKIGVQESHQRRPSPARAHEDRARPSARASDATVLPLVFESESSRRQARSQKSAAPTPAATTAPHRRPTAADFPPLGAPQEPAQPQAVVVLVRAADAPAVEKKEEVPVPQTRVADAVVDDSPAGRAPESAAAAAEDEMMAFFMQ